MFEIIHIYKIVASLVRKNQQTLKRIHIVNVQVSKIVWTYFDV
jgi:hypothetical protein